MNERNNKSDFVSLDRDIRSLGFRSSMMLWRAYKRTLNILKPASQHVTVFVTGAQRSGTNMLMECLDWSRETDAYHESDSRAFVDYQMRSSQVIHDLVNSSKSQFLVFKALCEAEQTTDLLSQFSPAKAVWVVRDFRDTVNSAVRNFPDFTARIREIVDHPGSTPGWFARGISVETHDTLKRLNVAEMNTAGASALRWYIRNILFFEQGLDKNKNVMLVNYGDLVSQPAVVLKEVFQFIGLRDYSPFIIRKIHGRSQKKNPAPNMHPEIYKACEELQSRFIRN